jgi:transcriptional regulator with XRE-family HTH domain
VDAPSKTLAAFGEYVRAQRRMARLTLRELADMTRVSNPYLSQIERGLHQPSVAVITSLAQALNLSAESLLAHAAGLDNERIADTEAVIRADARLSAEQKEALLMVYRGFVAASESTETPQAAEPLRQPSRPAPPAKGTARAKTATRT